MHGPLVSYQRAMGQEEHRCHLDDLVLLRTIAEIVEPGEGNLSSRQKCSWFG